MHETEILLHSRTQRVFNEALNEALLADPALVKDLGLPGFTRDCTVAVAFKATMFRDWDDACTSAEISFALDGLICGQVIQAEGTAKVKGLMHDWRKMGAEYADYVVENLRFEDLKVCAKIIA